jgi:hypothetical protein
MGIAVADGGRSSASFTLIASLRLMALTAGIGKVSGKVV